MMTVTEVLDKSCLLFW